MIKICVRTEGFNMWLHLAIVRCKVIYVFYHIEFSRWQSTKLAARPIADSRYIHPIAQALGVCAGDFTALHKNKLICALW